MTTGKGKRPAGQKRDFMEVARSVVEQAIGEKMDGSALPPSPNAKQLAGSKGGKKGGIARANGFIKDRFRNLYVPVEIRLTHYRPTTQFDLGRSLYL